MRGAVHHRVDRVRSATADLDQRADGVGNARADIGACGPLYGAQNRLPGQQDGIRIRPADIHTYAHPKPPPDFGQPSAPRRSEEHTSELQSLMRISYAVFCLKKKKHITNQTY